MSEITKPSLVFTIICDDIRQEIGGKISLMGLFENIYASNFPVIHPRLAIMTEWAEGKGNFEVMTRLISSNRKTVLRETVSKISFAEANYRHRDISVHLNIEFQAPGTYWIEHMLNGELISSVPLNVIQVKEQSFH